MIGGLVHSLIAYFNFHLNRNSIPQQKNNAMKKLVPIFILFLGASCLSDFRANKTLTIHAKSEIGKVVLYVVPTGNSGKIDSLFLELPQDRSQISYEWKPEVTEGTFVFGILGKEELTRSAGYYTNGVVLDPTAYYIAVYPDSLHIEDSLN